jgi:hypothetical protein
VKAKNHPKPNLEQIAAILIDAELNTVRHVCQTHGITRTTLYRYRSRLKTDAELRRLVTASLTTLKPPAPVPTSQAVIFAAYSWLRDSIPKLHPNPENVIAVTSAVKMFRQAEMAEKAMTEYLTALQRQQDRNDPRAIDAEQPGNSIN